ncbi:MAG: hypothetical protein ABIE42_01360 [Candidatus Eisenbacteria bacterium]
MKWTVFVMVAAAFIFFACAPALAKNEVASPIYDVEPGRYPNQVFWTDDMEGDVSGWSTADLSASASPHFHVDTYMAFAGSYSWWCGSFAYDADGGYGNSWDDRLNIPVTDVSAATYPIFTYAFRHDSETGYDYTYVQAESLGVFVNLNKGYDGTQPWSDIGQYGFIMATYDNPFVARFRFVSDGAWSDQDGDYLSVGGGFMCDNVKIFDYFGGYVYFYDDVESGGLCTPTVPAAAGDYWHVIDRMCPALSDPHSWWCGDDADTGFVPPLLQNALYSPLVDLTGAYTCTVHCALHFAIPQVDNDYLALRGTTDGVTYYDIAAYWGDFESCDGWGGGAYNTGFDITQFEAPPYTWGGFLWVMYTTDNGCGPAGAGDAGAMIDDVWFEGLHEDPVENASWSRVKALYR